MKKVLIVSFLMCLGLFTIVVHESQVKLINEQEAHIQSLSNEVTSKTLTIKKLENELERATRELENIMSRNSNENVGGIKGE